MASRRNRNQQDVRKMTENVKDIDLFTPMNDIIFKGIFAKNTEKSNRLLGSLISSVIGKPVGKVTLVNNEPAANSTEDKNIRMDVVCMTKHAGIKSGSPCETTRETSKSASRTSSFCSFPISRRERD